MTDTARETPQSSVQPIVATRASRSPSERDVTAAFREPPQRWLDVGHSRLAYRRFGSGPDLVLVHGWPLHSATFRRLVPFLADAFTCHVFDLPGTGQSVWDASSPIDLEAHGETVRRAIDRMELSRYAVYAHDSGAVAARLAVAGDSRLAGLVMGNTEIPGHHSAYLGLFLFLAKLPGGKNALLRSMTFGPIRRSKLGFGGCFTDPAYADGEFAEFFVRPLTDSRTASGHMRLLDTLDLSVVDRLPDVHALASADRIRRGLDSGPADPASRQRTAEAGGDGSRQQDGAADCPARTDHSPARRWLRHDGRCSSCPMQTRTGRADPDAFQ